MCLHLLISHVLNVYVFVVVVFIVLVDIFIILDRWICGSISLYNLTVRKRVGFVFLNCFNLILSSMIAIVSKHRVGGSLFKHFKLPSIQIQRFGFATLLSKIIFSILTRGLNHFIATARQNHRLVVFVFCLDQNWLERHCWCCHLPLPIKVAERRLLKLIEIAG